MGFVSKNEFEQRMYQKKNEKFFVFFNTVEYHFLGDNIYIFIKYTQ
jgi:hypothetical protein